MFSNSIFARHRRAALAGIAFLASGTLLSSVPVAQEADITQLGQIVIIGERQERTFVDTTSSVSVFDVNELEKTPGAEINDILTGSPNVQTRSISEIPNIRGIEGGGPGGLANTGLSGTLPRVPLIVDEVARPAAVPNVDYNSLWDVEQLELFKGPQTTLRGRTAIGGAFVLKTFDPTFDPEFAVQTVLEFDDFHGPTRSLNTMASFGIFDDILAFRGTLEGRDGADPRDIVNVPPGIDGNRLNEFDQLRGRAKLLFTPQGEEGPWRFLGIYEHQEGTTPQTRGTVQTTGFSDGRVVSPSQREIDYVTGGLRIFDTEANTYALDSSYTFADGSKLRSITSQADTFYESLPFQPQNFFFKVDDDVFNQDLLYTFGTDESRLSGLFGATYTYRTQDVRIDNIIPPFLPPGIAFLTADGDTETVAAFTDLRVGLTRRLDLLAGGRVLRHEYDRTTFSSLTAVPPFNVPPVLQTDRDTETVGLPLIGLKLDVDETQSVSVTARKGWNEGGASVNFFTGQPYTFESEEVWTYEAGYRLESQDKRYSFGATTFFSKYDNPQFFLETQPGNRFSIQVVNLPKGETYGAEFEGEAAVTDSLTLRAGVGLLETEITEAPAGNPQLKGNHFGKDPDITAFLGFVWNPAWKPNFSFDGKVAFIGQSFNDFNNRPAEKIGDYTIVDLGLSYERGPITGRAFVNNVFDETGLTALVISGASNFAAVTPPRTAGFSLTARF